MRSRQRASFGLCNFHRFAVRQRKSAARVYGRRNSKAIVLNSHKRNISHLQRRVSQHHRGNSLIGILRKLQLYLCTRFQIVFLSERRHDQFKRCILLYDFSLMQSNDKFERRYASGSHLIVTAAATPFENSTMVSRGD